MRQQFPIYEKSSRWPYNPPQDPKFYRRFDVALKLAISAAIIGVTYLIIRPTPDYEAGYMWWVLSIVGCLVVAMVASRYLPPFLYGYVMINKHYWKIDLELEEITSRIDEIVEQQTNVVEEPTTEDAAVDDAAEPVSSAESVAEVDETTVTQPKAPSKTKFNERISAHNIDSFVEECERKRSMLESTRLEQEGKKLDRILKYVRLTLLQYGFTDEDLVKVHQSVLTLITEKSVIKIAKPIHRKDTLTQADLKHLAWNIGHQYGIKSTLIGDFVYETFKDWFFNTSKATITRKLKSHTKGCSIPIDENILASLPKLEAIYRGSPHPHIKA